MFCPKCGTQNLDTNKFCKKCGKNLPDRAQIRQAVPQNYSSPQRSNFIGQVLDGKYRIDAKLGSGGMGDVYRSTRLLIGDTVAVKILHPHLARDPQAAERFRREAVMATKLRHRNVVGIYDVGISPVLNVPYILMEMAEGYTLRQIIDQYRVLPLDFVVTVTTQVCSALDEAHGLGIVHRDIKPENIVANQTTTGWYIKVLDFGIAKLYNQGEIGLTQDGNAMGTPQYMSPEQCLGEDLDARSDIYSMGIMLYEMLSGTVPFKSPTASAIAIHQVQTAPDAPRTLNSEIHPDVEGVVLRSLAKQREYRQQKASQLAQELIKAATTAFKSGFTEVASAPIPKPDVVPEFGPAVVAGEAMVEDPVKVGGPVDSPAIVPVVDIPSAQIPINAAPVVSEEEDIIAEAERKAAARRSDENSHQESGWHTPVDPVHETPISTPDFTRPDDPMLIPERLVEVKEVTTSEGSARVESFSEVPSSPVYLEAQPEYCSGVAVKAAYEKSGAVIEDTNLSQVFEDAELLLDKIIPDEHPVIEDIPVQLLSEPAAAEHKVLPSSKSDAFEGSAAQQQESDQVPTFGITPETSPKRGKFLIPAVAIVGIVSIAIVAGYMFISWQKVENTPVPAEQLPPVSAQPPKGMALVPGGEFMMGSDTGDRYSRPAHKVVVSPFYMDMTEVTNEEYKKFVDATKHKPPPGWKNGTFPDGKARFPVTGVDWDDADSFAKWAGKRLPSEEEWEFAARGTDGRVYPWGNEWKYGFANAGPTMSFREVGGGDGKSPFGIMDMAGNAWEWTASDFAEYPGGTLSTKMSGAKVIRGGCFKSNRNQATTIYRRGWLAIGADGYQETGFRCAKDIPPASQ